MREIEMKVRGRVGVAGLRHGALGVVIVGIAVSQGCTSESVTAVGATAVSVMPPSVSTVSGERVQFAATVRDERNKTLSSAPVTWASDDERIVSMDQDGTARAVSPGLARIRATFRGVSGTAMLRVIAMPSPPPDPDPDASDGLLDELLGGDDVLGLPLPSGP